MKIVSLCHPPFHEWFHLNEIEKRERQKEEDKQRRLNLFAYEQDSKAKIDSAKERKI